MRLPKGPKSVRGSQIGISTLEVDTRKFSNSTDHIGGTIGISFKSLLSIYFFGQFITVD